MNMQRSVPADSSEKSCKSSPKCPHRSESNIIEPHGELSVLELRERELFTKEQLADMGISPDVAVMSMQNADLAEKILAEELQKLTLAEHEEAVFDVHGIAQTHNQDPPNVDTYLEQLEQEIQKIRNKQSYVHAKYINPDYVSNRTFRLMFLRCDRFDVKLAAQRIVFHFQIKENMFGGGDIIGREVRLSDLTNVEMGILESGFMQVVPTRDAAGRTVFTMSPVIRPPGTPWISVYRAMWYFFSVILREEDSQRIGVVGVLMNVGENARLEALPVVQGLNQMRRGAAKKFVAIHYCVDDVALKPQVTNLAINLDKESRRRFRLHLGTPEFLSFTLQTYGIPIKESPIKLDGSVSLEWHRQWVQARQKVEGTEQGGSTEAVIVPRRFDVLFGRGKHTREHTGNLRAAHLVEMFQTEYEQAGKFEKTKIATRIVNMIHESYGRFLKWNRNVWEEVDDDAAREKISHFFRHLRSKVPDGSSTTYNSDATSTVTTSSKRQSPSPALQSESSFSKSIKSTEDETARSTSKVLHNIPTDPITDEPTSLQDDQNPSGLPEELADLEAKDRSLLGDQETITKAGLATNQLPKSWQEADIADKVLSEDFKKLSLDEQEKAIFALHGLPRQNDEDPDEIDARLEQLQQELDRIRRKEAYNLAVYLNESYVTGKPFRLLFLRCDNFDTKLAAQRIVFHFEAKKKLFGEKEVLGRDIRQSDLSPAEVHLLHSGFLQTLSTPDAAGRPIFLIAPALRPTDVAVEVIHRVMWYFFHLQLTQEEAQQKGIVGVWIQLGKNPKLFVHRPAFQGVLQMRSSFPVKWAGLHFCFDDPSIRLHVTGLSMNMNKEMRKHLRIHFGNFETIKFELGTFGIQLPPDVILGDGTVSTDPHLEWTSARRSIESEADKTDRWTMIPRRFDVLFGRGERTRGHTGNLRAAHLVEMHRSEYEEAQRMGKTEIAEKIVDMIHDSYGRFMRWDAKGWVEVSHEAAREKVSHFFRHLRSKKPNPSASSLAQKPTEGDNHAAKEAEESSSASESGSSNKRRAPPMADAEVASEPTKRVTPSPSPSPSPAIVVPVNQFTTTPEGTNLEEESS
eukprot:Nitzschia sp. Nitz4//scaffold44_size153857//42605//46236//NITZ4_002709-RA/size153857-augustus-gene-0.2-mRNA-1//1//CDS//3329552121//5594//frame0